MAARAAGVPVTLVDNSQKSLDKGLSFADKLLSKDVSKQKLSQEDADAIRGRLTGSTSMDDLSNVDMVIEAVPEIVDLKTKIFAQLAATCPAHAILATNTSSISITRIAAATTTVRTRHPTLSDERAECEPQYMHRHTKYLSSDRIPRTSAPLPASCPRTL